MNSRSGSRKSGRTISCAAILSVVLTLLFTATGNAQTSFGSVVGSVTDQTGSMVPEAQVTLLNLGTAETRTIRTDKSGSYQFVNLVPGEYRVAIEHAGYKRRVVDGLQVQVQAALRADTSLEVGAVTETVEVTTQTALLQTEQSSISQAVEGRTVQEMPLNGRNVLNLVGLVPGVVPQGSTSGNPLGNQGGGATTNPNGWGNYQIGGGQANQSASFFDGAPLNTSYVNSVVLVPTQDAVQEFRVATNSVSPEFGRFAGGVINLASKSGTNAYHGGLYEYFRNKVLNANNFFNNRTGIARPAFSQNQFGANFSGPIRKEKTFFMFTWEDFSLRIGIPTVTTVPTTAMRAGDFSALCTTGFNSAGVCNTASAQIYDPLTTCGKYSNAACTTSGVYTRQPFAGNIVPANRIDPTSKVMSNLWGLPNATGTNNGTLNNFSANGNGGGDQYQYNGRVDHSINDANRLFARYTYWNGHTIPNDLFKTLANANLQRFSTNSAVLGHTWTISPTTVADFRLSYLRFTFGFYPPNTGLNLATYGPAYAALQNQVTFPQYPNPSVTGFSTFSNTTVRNINNNEAFSASLTKILGRHSLKFGGESRKIEWGYGQTGTSSGSFTFTTGFTAQNPASPTASGYAFSSFLLGYAATGQAQQIKIAKQEMWYDALYVADNFQLNPKLTLNLGVRWEYPGQFTESHDSAAVFLPTATDPLGSSVGLNLMGPVASVNSTLYGSRAIHPPTYELFAPRLGLAYRLSEKSVFRTGYGLSFLPSDVVFGNAPWTTPSNLATTVMASTLDSGITPYAVVSNPFPGGLAQPLGHASSSAVENTVIGSVPQVPIPNERAPYVQQWNVALQQQLGGAAFEIGYAGSKGTFLPLNSVVSGFPFFQADQLPDQYMALGTALTQQVANPFYGKVPSTAGVLAQPTVASGQLLRPYPQYTGVNNTSQMHGGSIYHSLQTKVERRFKTGGTLLGTYTWAKLLSNSDTVTSWLDGGVGIIQDWTNPRAERSLASYDVRHRATISYVLDLPFGRGRAFAAHAPGVVDALISDWGINGTTTFQAGFPLLLSAQPTTFSSNFGAGTPRPNVVQGCATQLSGSSQSKISQWFNKSCFSQPGAFAYGNEPRADSTLRSAGIANFDVAVSRNFSIMERAHLRFETEFFNLFNRVQFGAPNTVYGNPSFGQVTAIRNNPRLIQFALRASF